MLDDFRGFTVRERVSLNGVRGMGQLHIVIFLQARQSVSRQRTQTVKLFFFCLDGGLRDFPWFVVVRLLFRVNSGIVTSRSVSRISCDHF